MPGSAGAARGSAGCPLSLVVVDVLALAVEAEGEELVVAVASQTPVVARAPVHRAVDNGRAGIDGAAGGEPPEDLAGLSVESEHLVPRLRHRRREDDAVGGGHRGEVVRADG